MVYSSQYTAVVTYLLTQKVYASAHLIFSSSFSLSAVWEKLQNCFKNWYYMYISIRIYINWM